MRFTGERYIPEASDGFPFSEEMTIEHYLRYFLARKFVHGKDVLDIACGAGYGSAILASSAKSVIGVDISDDAVDHASEIYQLDNLTFRQGDAADIPLPDSSIDIVVSFETIEHHARHEKMMREVVRVLRPTGQLLLSSPDKSTNGDRLPPNSNPYHVKELYREELEDLIAKHFEFYEICEQKTLFCSIVRGTKNDGQLVSWREQDISLEQFSSGYDGIKEPKYFIVLASNAKNSLAPIPNALLESSPLHSELVKLEQSKSIDKIQTLENDLQNLKKIHHEMTLQNEQALQHATDTILQYEATLSGLVNSRSWKITAPLRAGANFVRKVRNKIFHNKGHHVVSPERGRPHIALISGAPEIQAHVYRVSRLARVLNTSFDVSIIPITDIEKNLSSICSADIIWVWRAAMTSPLNKVLLSAKENNRRIIFDIDDMCFHPSHFQPQFMDAIRTELMDTHALQKLGQDTFAVLQFADICSLPTEPLAREVYRLSMKPTIVIPNTFDRSVQQRALTARQQWLDTRNDSFIRIGYAAGTKTHQADFKRAVPGLVTVLKNNPEVRLVLFKGMIDLTEFRDLQTVQNQIEWRDVVPLDKLPDEVARFDINIAPLDTSNVFCQCKSQLKFFESALSGIPSITSATEPMKAVIQSGQNGFLVEDDNEWEIVLQNLIDDKQLLNQIGHNARRSVLWTFGPENLTRLSHALVRSLLEPTTHGTALFVANDIMCHDLPLPVEIPRFRACYSSCPPTSRVAVVIPLYNYQKFIIETLNSILAQTYKDIDVIVVDDASTDDSAQVAQQWLQENACSFSSTTLLQNQVNSGLSLTRNAGIEYSNAEYIMLLDADNLLLPECIECCVNTLDHSTAAMTFPELEVFGDAQGVMGSCDWQPLKLKHGNYIDAMSMVRKAHWVALGGYTRQDLGWEDYDFWCKMVRYGFWGEHIPRVLAKYRVHNTSMLRTVTEVSDAKKEIIHLMNERHSWLRL